MRTELIPGRNVDRLDIGAGLLELTECGYNDHETNMIIEYALIRWMRGEEDAAERGAVDHNFFGVSITVWRRVLSAAMAAAQVPNVKLRGCASQ